MILNNLSVLFNSLLGLDCKPLPVDTLPQGDCCGSGIL